jgi:hypothetical protein
MAIIPIKSRPDKHILMDDEVADVIGCWNWNLSSHGYAMAYIKGTGRKNQKFVQCSRMVYWVINGQYPEKGFDIDHINHNTLDNRYKNLRMVTRSINMRNKVKCDKTTSSYYGVSYRKDRKTFVSDCAITLDGKYYHVRGSSTKNEGLAAQSVDCIRHLLGGFILFNFPEIPFKEKWEKIGEPQRKQILNSLKKNGFKAVGG